jgi:hypothetical protein
MRLSVVRTAFVIGGLGLVVTPLHAQGYNVRLDTWYQSVAYRGWTQDSVRASSAVQDADGSWFTPGGIAARCPAGGAYCTFYAPGPELRGQPLVTTIDGSLWGFGVSGLRAQVRARIGTDLSNAFDEGAVDTSRTVWPAVDPSVQLLEGYLEYVNRRFTAQVGRINIFSRLGWVGLDGSQVSIRPLGGRLKVGAWGGWALARGTPLPITSGELDPLGEYRPTVRPIVLGGELGWTLPGFEGRLLYQSEIDTDVEKLVGERGAAEMAVRPGAGFTVLGGLEYDFGVGQVGTYDFQVKYSDPRGRGHVAVGERRYRPYFPLWSVWLAFSPLPYHTSWGSIALYPVRDLELRARGETYRYDLDDDDALLPSTIEDSGWRWSMGATYAGFRNVTLDANYRAEFGPGASNHGWDSRVVYTPQSFFTASAHMGYLLRPLEYRWNDAKVWTYGFRGDFKVRNQFYLNFAVMRYDESRNRPDAAAFSWDQTRISAGLTMVFSSTMRSRSLHPAILRMPETRRSR